MTARTRTGAALAAWTLLLALAWLLGQAKLANTAGRLQLDAMPLYGSWELHLDATLLAPLAAGALAIAVLPAAAARWRWRYVIIATAAAAILFSTALALAHSHPQTWSDLHNHYASHAHLVDDAGGLAPFLRHYTDAQLEGAYPVHLQSHPPGLVLFFWGATSIGLSGLVFQNAAIQVAVAAAVTAALMTGRDVAGSGSPAAPRRSWRWPRPRSGTTTPTWCSRASPSPPWPASSWPPTAPAPERRP